jgi:hypothetical protein
MAKLISKVFSAVKTGAKKVATKENYVPTPISVKSTNLKSVTYNEVTDTLTILFMSGRTYAFMKVPKRTYTNLLSAKSKGDYFARWIKHRYTYKEI